jgi:hypothetical protein
LSDPRLDPKWKQNRHEQRVELLLGAILDALKDKHVPVKAAKAKAEKA